jgi:hypothetical protein
MNKAMERALLAVEQEDASLLTVDDIIELLDTIENLEAEVYKLQYDTNAMEELLYYGKLRREDGC